MLFAYTGTGGLFTRLGQIGAGILDVETFLGTSGTPTGLKTVGPRTDTPHLPRGPGLGVAVVG
jgi:hypothetical protein